MIRLNLLLVLVAVFCAIGVVTAQHKARKLFTELQQEQALASQMDVEWGQLQLEQSTWAMHARIEKIASGSLEMQVPVSNQVQVVSALPDPVGATLSQAKPLQGYSVQDKPPQVKALHP